MDILIKGMEMPKSCYTCQFCDNYEGSFCLATNDEHQIDHMTAIRRRPKWCPLVALPEHGDLIQRDNLFEFIEKNEEVTVGEIYDFIQDEPVIVEASNE